jgi:hypothetical protein
MKNKSLVMMIISTALIASCAMMPASVTRSDGVMMEEMPAEAWSGAAPEAPKMAFESSDAYVEEAGYAAPAGDVERIVIKNANLSIVVDDPAVSMDAITRMAEGMGGFVVSSNLYKTTTRTGVEVPIANVTVRVPADRLESALDQIKAMVENPRVDILSEDISGQDVTSEVTDLESRLRNLRAAETQLLEIMEMATESGDVIAIFRELTSVREQIEVTEGQIKYYRESARLSAIYVNLQAKEALEPITIGRWQPGLEAQRAIQALLDGGKFLVNAFIWIVLFAIPILAVIALPIFLIVKFFRKRAQRRHEAKESPEPVEKKK